MVLSNRFAPCRSLAAIAIAFGVAGCSLVLEDAGDGDGDGDGDGICGFVQQLAIAAQCSVGLQMAPELVAGEYLLNTTDSTFTVDGLDLGIDLQIVAIDSVDVAVWYVQRFDIPADVRIAVTGGPALLIASEGAIVIDGHLDASSDATPFSRPGPGSNGASCEGSPGTPPNSVDGNRGGSGGGGGGGQGSGGTGGDGNSSDGPNTGAGGGAAFPVSSVFLFAGCGGGQGGVGEGTSRKANGGIGGGAVHLAARESITLGVEGTVDVSGAGGEGGLDGGSNGGGGGGGGGTIILEAPTLMQNGVLNANGGGGGGGSNAADSSMDGTDGGTTPAPGGEGGLDYGGGGEGSFGEILPGVDAQPAERGAGGGGGAAGWIVAFAEPSQSSGTSSPPLIVLLATRLPQARPR